MVDRTTLLPSSLRAACDAEAELWARETNAGAWLDRFSTDPRKRAKLKEIAEHCVSEGVFRGVCLAIDRKPLADSIIQAREARAGDV